MIVKVLEELKREYLEVHNQPRIEIELENGQQFTLSERCNVLSVMANGLTILPYATDMVFLRTSDYKSPPADKTMTDTLKDIIDQLQSCRYTCEAGSLESNTAFIELCKIGGIGNLNQRRKLWPGA